MSANMDWNASMLLLHLAGLIFAGMLCRKSPCGLQLLVMIGYVGNMAAMCVGFYGEATNQWWGSTVLMAGYGIGDAATLLLLFRIVVFPSGLTPWTYSKPYRSS